MRKKQKLVSLSDLVKHPASCSLSHKKRALSLTIGFFLALFPVIGCTTALCIAACFTFRLNTFLVLGMNLLLAPIQVLLMIPFLRFGQLLFFSHCQLNTEINWYNLFKPEFWDSYSVFLAYAGGGILLWGFLSFFTGFFVYRLFYKYSILLVK